MQLVYKDAGIYNKPRLCCHCLWRAVVALLLPPLFTVGFMCACHLCLCAYSSWRWHDSSHLCVPLQGAKSFRSPFQGHLSCILVTQCFALQALVNLRLLKALKGLFFFPSTSVIKACNYHWKVMKWFKNIYTYIYYRNTLLSILCIVHIIISYLIGSF